MADHVENAGKKGYCLMWFIIFFILFISLWAYLYFSNTRLEF